VTRLHDDFQRDGAVCVRGAFSVRFLGDDATHVPRPWQTSPEFPGLADELPADVPMEHELFPVPWPPAD